MAINVGVGRSTSRRATEAGANAARAALADLGGDAGLLLVFATTGYPQEELLEAIRSVPRAGGVPLAGCSAEGVITQDGSNEGSHCVAVMAIRSDRMTFRTILAENFAADPVACGRKVAEQVRASGQERGVLVLLPDGLTGNVSELIRSVTEGVPPGIRVVGGGAGEMMQLQRTYQYGDGRISSDSVAAALLGGAFVQEITVSHGCTSLGLEHRITKSEGAIVKEIDHRPAWEVVRDYLDGTPDELDALQLSHACVGAPLEDAEETRNYGDLIIRVPMRLIRETGALFYPGGLAEGARVAFVHRDVDTVSQRVIADAARIRSLHAKKPSLVLQFDCTGRGRLLFGNATTERLIDPVQRELGKDVPWLGFHCYGEIAPIGRHTYYHNYTVALCAVYDEAA